MILEHDCVVLTYDKPDDRLKSGDVGTVVHVHRESGALEVEISTLTGVTVCVTTVPASHMRPVNAYDLAHAREVVTG